MYFTSNFVKHESAFATGEDCKLPVEQNILIAICFLKLSRPRLKNSLFLLSFPYDLRVFNLNGMQTIHMQKQRKRLTLYIRKSSGN